MVDQRRGFFKIAGRAFNDTQNMSLGVPLMMRNCFILDIDCRLNYESLRRIVLSGGKLRLTNIIHSIISFIKI